MRPSPDRIFDHREFPVLYVDDEPENLRIFELTFRREFSILTAGDAEEGLRVLNESPVAVVLSDHRMPGMSGVDFLSRVKELDPNTLRILVTAYGDAGTLESAINAGSIYRFVPKPWTPEDMRLTVRRAIEVYALEREREQLLSELTLLNRVSKSINQELELPRLIRLLLATVTEEFGFDAGCVALLDDEQRILTFAGYHDECAVNEVLHQIAISDELAPSFMGRLRAGDTQLLAVENAFELEGPIKRWVTEVAADEVLVVPLIGQSGPLGAVAVDNRRGGRRFRAEDRTLLEGLTHQAATAIENARLVQDLRRSREQILRADRLGTLGTLAAGLAHEINNPLVSIHTFLSMAPSKREQPDAEFWGDYHDLACREVDRIRRLVDTMRRLGRGGGSEVATRETVDALGLVEEVRRLLAREAKKAGVELALEAAPDTPKVSAVRDHLHQLVMNLLLNAIHASPRGAKVVVRTACEQDGTLRLEVEDRGPGIAEEDLERVFDPFFTTKGPDQGTGLGLMICHRVVEDHGGSIQVRSHEGQGATFVVRLPGGPALGRGAILQA